MRLKKINGFTLVEIIIVISILIILLIITFISFKGYITQSRDANKISTIKSIDNGLKLYALKFGRYPILDESDLYGTGLIDNILVSNYGRIGDFLSKIINLNSIPVDPTNNYYLYGISFNKKYYQIATMLENEDYVSNRIVSKTYAKENNSAYMLGNYDGLLIYNSGSNLKYIINLPSLIFSQTGTIDVIQSEPYFLYNGKKIGFTKNELLKEITGKNISLTGLIVTNNQNQVNEVSEILGYNKQKVGEKIFGSDYKGVISTKKLGIYYGWPSSLNNDKNSYWLNKVIQDFNQYNSIVLGQGLEKTTHGDYQNTKDVLNGTNTGTWYAPEGFLGYKGVSYGYVTLKNDINSIKQSIDEWKKLGVKGIFFDEAGYDFLIDNYIFTSKSDVRNHQNTAIDYSHQLGLKVIMNSWNIDDVFGVNYGENKINLKSGDSYLLEDFVYNPTIPSPYYDYDNQLQKIQKALIYKNNFSIDLHCVGLLPNSSYINKEKIDIFYNKSLRVCDYIQITEKNFGTSGSKSPLINYLKEYN